MGRIAGTGMDTTLYVQSARAKLTPCGMASATAGANVVKFSHPLARSARFWFEESIKDGVHDIFVVVTTLELDAGHKKFRLEKVDRLREAAKAYLKERSPHVHTILLMNPPKA